MDLFTKIVNNLNLPELPDSEHQFNQNGWDYSDDSSEKREKLKQMKK